MALTEDLVRYMLRQSGIWFTICEEGPVARQAAGMSGFDLSNAMVVVTGAGAGIGQGIAQAFHAAGGRVAVGEDRKSVV